MSDSNHDSKSNSAKSVTNQQLSKESADEFDKGWQKDAKSGLSLQLGQDKEGKSIEHTFFGGDEFQSTSGMNMLISE